MKELININKLKEQAKEYQKNKEFLVAINLYQQIADYYEQQKNQEQQIEFLLKIGWVYTRILFFQTDQLPQQAEVFITDTTQLTKEKLGSEHPLMVNAQLNHIFWYCYGGKKDEAVDLARKTLATYEPILGSDHETIIKLYEEFTHLSRNIPDIETIIEILTEVETYFEAKPKHLTTQLVTCHISWMYFYIQHQSPQSMEYYEKAYQLIGNQKGFEKQQIRLSLIAGIHYYNEYEPDIAISYFQEGVYVCLEHLPKDEQLPYLYMNLANSFMLKSDNEQAIYYFQEALENAQGIFGSKNIFIAYVYSNMSGVLRRLNRLEEALQALKEGLIVAQQLNSPLQMGLMDNLASILMNLEKYEEAIRLLKESQQLEKQFENDSSKNVHLIYNRLIRFATAYWKLEQLTEASEYIQQAILLQYQQGNEIVHFYQTPYISDPEYIFELIDALRVKTKILYAQYQSDTKDLAPLLAAIYNCQLTAQLIIKARNNFIREDSKILLASLEETKGIYFYANKVALEGIRIAATQPLKYEKALNEIIQLNQQHCPTSNFQYVRSKKDLLQFAFQCSEQEKAVLLLEQVQKNEQEIGDTVGTELRKQQKNIEATLNFVDTRIKRLEEKMWNTEEPALKKKWQLKISQLQAENVETTKQYKRLKEKIEKKFTSTLDKEQYNHEIVSIQAIQEILEDRQLLLNYMTDIETETIYAYVVSNKQFEMVVINKENGYKKQIKTLLRAINQIRYTKFVKAAYQLYQYLIQPLLPQIEANRTNDLIIIPHGKLSQVPFEALLTTDASTLSTTDYSELPYLIHQYNISYHLSASLFYHIKTNQKDNMHEAESFVGFAPVYLNQQATNAADPTQASISPQALESVGVASRSLRIGEADYEALIYSEEEVKNVKALFEDQTNEASIYLHEQATKSNFEEVVQNKKYIHIAAHGYETKTSTDLTGIVFSPQAGDQEQEDAILYLQEMSQLQLTAELVVLSSCKSGIGKQRGGEGMMAMNRGFLAAGAQNVVYTLFKIYDQSSSEFVKIFFEQVIQQQKNYNEALRIAKQQLIKQQHFTPKHWAGFVLIGQ